MRKMAIFVEGQTERIFVERILVEIAGANGLKIESFLATGGGKSGARTLTRNRVFGPSGGFTHFVMIVDCGADNRVRSDIGDQYTSLAAAGYSVIMGIRDVYPEFNFADIAKLRNGLNYRLKTYPIRAQFVLGVMEIESWFLAEYSHFQKLDPALTPSMIARHLGFDPVTHDLQLRLNPAADLHSVYQLAGFAYRKSRNHVDRTVNLIDYATLYLQTKSRFPDMDQFVATIDGFLN